jgi:hypothetical protein
LRQEIEGECCRGDDVTPLGCDIILPKAIQDEICHHDVKQRRYAKVAPDRIVSNLVGILQLTLVTDEHAERAHNKEEWNADREMCADELQIRRQLQIGHRGKVEQNDHQGGIEPGSSQPVQLGSFLHAPPAALQCLAVRL